MTLTTVKYDDKKKHSITSSDILLTSIILALCILGITYYLELQVKGFWAITLLGCVVVPVFTIIYGWKEYYPIDFIETGTLVIDDNSITLNGKEYHYETLRNIEFVINDFKGKRLRSPGLLWDAGPSLSQGVDNKIEFEFEGKHISRHFQLKSEEQFRFLGDRLKKMYLLGLSFSEKLNNSKSYGLEHLNYQAIQKFKKKYYS